LGVLKADTIAFAPPLPATKRESIAKLGMGILNKIAIRFEDTFWEKNHDWIGKVCSCTMHVIRVHLFNFQFYSCSLPAIFVFFNFNSVFFLLFFSQL
jgi:hypothetical protein